MRFEKRLTKPWPMCYVASTLTDGENVWGAFASESQDTTGALAISENWEEFPLWDAPGGCMGIVQIPGTREFLTIQRFYPVFQSREAEIGWYYLENGNWVRKKLMTVPFVHRIEVLKENGELYLLICKLCQDKAYIEDWSTPGSVLACKLNVPGRCTGDLETVLDGLFRNHGLVKLPGENDRVLIAHSGGIHQLEMTPDGQWLSCQIWDEPCSDVAVTGVEPDGSFREMGVITPFHGEQFRILRLEDGQWREHCCVEDVFGHGIWGGRLAGKPCYLVGFRGGTRSIYCIEPEEHRFRISLVDTGVGCANLTVFSWGGRSYIGSANRESDSITIYCAEADE